MSGFRRMMTYLGLVEDDEYDDEVYDDVAPAPPARPARPVNRDPDSMNGIRTLQPREREMSPEPRSGVTVTRPSVVRPITPTPSPRVHTVTPSSFQDAQEIGDRVKAGVPVIVNLQAVERDLMRRIIDFTSGLMYGLGGDMEKAADRVFLLTPTNVEVSPEEKRRLQERGLYRS